ncbi:MAG TPA: DUF3224 domain-containing protein [Marmoricola sp.]|nr:DUF3224 domain-containing protein [Marmoricola sp.]
MQTTSTFTVESFDAAELEPPATVTGTPVGVARMIKQFRGGLEGRAETLFTSAFDQDRGVGTYLAMESFTGSLDGRAGTVNLAHTATTDGGPERLHEVVVIVPGSGTEGLEGMTGTGRIRIDADGTHHLDLEYELG